MHIHKFADLACFDEIGIRGTFPATEEYQDFIKKLHPSQFLSGGIRATLYEVTYSYTTIRGNARTAKKYTLLRLEHEDYDMEIEMQLADWVKSHNAKRPYRRISNVNILEIRPLAYAGIRFEI